MNVQQITMDPDVAREQLREYRRALHKRADAEYEAVAKGLEALADGTPIINLTDAIRTGGFFDSGLPKLAIARADRTMVTAQWRSPFGTGSWFGRTLWHPRGTLFFDTLASRGRAGHDMAHAVNLGTEYLPKDSYVRGSTLVPMIPASVRNTVRFDARKTFILFEVEAWRPIPHRDPFLLRHLACDAYALLAAWDLTPLEQMVMAGRAGAN